MRKLAICVFLLLGIFAFAQTETVETKKKVYRITYNESEWSREKETKWDLQFADNMKLITAYVFEFNYYVTDDKMENIVIDQFKSSGKVKNYKVEKRELNGMTVNYFQCELRYADIDYVYQGFLYNGPGGTVELYFRSQKESLAFHQKKIDEFCKGFRLAN
jgi:hypothetical protein